MSLNQLFDQFIGGNRPAWSNPTQEGSGISKITQNVPGGLVGGLAAGGLLGVLVGNKKMRKKAGKIAGGAVGLGGAAVLGAVAFNAYKNWQEGRNPPSAPTAGAMPADPAGYCPPAPADQIAVPTQFDATQTVSSDGHPFQATLIKAMIAAANADGHIDSTEQAAIFEAVNKLHLDAAGKALVFDTLQNPPDAQAVASLAVGLEQASEIYLVSRLAIDPDHPLERAYLNELATMMWLPEGLVTQLESQVGEQQERAVA